MRTLTAVLTHLPPPDVHASYAFLKGLAPDASFVVCYGGTAADFDAIELEHKLFVDDATLRGPQQHLQSLTVTFELLWSGYFARDSSLDSLYLIEYDHLILDPRFEARLRDLAGRTGADLMGKTCVERTATNDEHYIRFRKDPGLLAQLRRVSVRDDPTRLFGCLGDGMWISRRALEAYVAVDDHPPCYCETYVPTLLHHLGFGLVDIDAQGDLYRYVRWTPPFTAEDVIAALGRGAVFVHPVKDPEAVRAARASLGGLGIAEPRHLTAIGD